MLAPNATIPLFPLNVVLFPGMMLPLHIFEKRYQRMTRECIDSGEPFGVVLVKVQPNLAGDILDDLYRIGTTAQITAVEHLQDGQVNLIAVGQDRFIIKDIRAEADNLLRGRVDPYPMQDVDSLAARRLGQQLRPIIKRYINHLADASGEDLSEAVLPTDPTALAFLAGTAIQGALPDKQQLLSAQSLNSLIANAVKLLQREDKILVYMLKAYQTHRQEQRLPFVDYCLN
jgi:Lon protease-like protein